MRLWKIVYPLWKRSKVVKWPFHSQIQARNKTSLHFSLDTILFSATGLKIFDSLIFKELVFGFRRSYTEWFVWYDLYDLFGFKISLYKSEEIELILSLKIVTYKFSCRELQFCNLHVQVSQIILKPNKRHANRIIETVPCKAAFTVLILQ